MTKNIKKEIKTLNLYLICNLGLNYVKLTLQDSSPKFQMPLS